MVVIHTESGWYRGDDPSPLHIFAGAKGFLVGKNNCVFKRRTTK